MKKKSKKSLTHEQCLRKQMEWERKHMLADLKKDLEDGNTRVYQYGGDIIIKGTVGSKRK